MISFKDQTEENYLEDDYSEYLEEEDDTDIFSLEEEEIDDDFYLFGECDVDDDQDFEWNYPSPGLVPPTAEERKSWTAFNRELDLILIPDYEKNSAWH